MTDPTTVVLSVLIVPLVAWLVRSSVTDERASLVAVVAALVAAAILVTLATPLVAAGAALLALALALRAQPRADLHWASAAATVALAALDPGLGLAALVASPWNAAKPWVPYAEAGGVAIVGVMLHGTSPPAALFLAGSALAVGLLVRRIPPVGRVPTRARVATMLRAGVFVGILLLLAVDSRAHLVQPTAVLRAIAYGAAGAGAGVLLMLVPVGALALLAVRDEARLALAAGGVGALLAGLVSPPAMYVALLPALVLCAGAGAARAWALLLPLRPRRETG